MGGRLNEWPASDRLLSLFLYYCDPVLWGLRWPIITESGTRSSYPQKTGESSMSLLRTPLFQTHKDLGAKMVPYAGWEMPVEYPQGLREEHMATRKNIGLFDVSHMGEISVQGTQSVAFLQKILTNDVSKCVPQQAQYHLMLNENGGVIDDLIIYCIEKDKNYLLVVNAANKDKDWAFIQEQAKAFSDLKVSDDSAQWAQVAVQGPKAVELMSEFFPESKALKKFRFAQWEASQIGGQWLVARTGYTGEDGFEVYGSPEKINDLWKALCEQGEKYGLLPCGLGARNSLRIEAALPLYGNEFSETNMPFGVGMDWAIKLQKAEDFIGKKALLSAKEAGKDNYTIVGLKTSEKMVPRDGYRVLSFDKEQIGHVTSGTYSPFLEQPIALAMIQKGYDTKSNKTCLVEVRQKLMEVEFVELPFIARA